MGAPCQILPCTPTTGALPCSLLPHCASFPHALSCNLLYPALIFILPCPAVKHALSLTSLSLYQICPLQLLVDCSQLETCLAFCRAYCSISCHIGLHIAPPRCMIHGTMIWILIPKSTTHECTAIAFSLSIFVPASRLMHTLINETSRYSGHNFIGPS